MKDFERLMRGAHDGRWRKPPREFYDQAAEYGVTAPAVIESLYRHASQWNTHSPTATKSAFRNLLQRERERAS